MATKEEKIRQYRANRLHALWGWYDGGPVGASRWEGDDPTKEDAKMLTDKDIMWMKLSLTVGGLNSDTKTKYETIINAQQAEFERLDAIYETEKAAAEDD